MDVTGRPRLKEAGREGLGLPHVQGGRSPDPGEAPSGAALPTVVRVTPGSGRERE